ncbi:MAG: hypothetical protein QOK24_23 [Verrucomicrobiota bacterium]|jgi:hypothetical protein
MKRRNSFVLGVVACALWFATANQISAGQSLDSRSRDGLLRMKHSPVLGINVPIAIRIDGAQAGVFAKGHIYERYLAPGRHDVYASRPDTLSDSWYGTLDVRPGGTYSFVVKCTPNQVMLLPVSRIN